MASILFAWELGGGSGHCVNLMPIAAQLIKSGHEVWLAARDLQTAERVFGMLPVKRLQAPILREPPPTLGRKPQSFADILHNVGFGSSAQLTPLVQAWRHLFALTRSSVIVCEHSPVALLASRFTDARRNVIGTGFFAPPDSTPLPCLVRGSTTSGDLSAATESAVLRRVNELLAGNSLPKMDRLSQLYAEVDENFLLTFRELDHYAPYRTAEYWGMWSPAGGTVPSYSAARGPKVFAYLQPPQYAWRPSTLLKVLRDMRLNSIVYVPGVEEKWYRPYGAEHIRFETQRLDINAVCNACDVAITHGNNGTATHLLRSGVPQLLMPLFLEQAIFCRRIAETGAGATTPVDQPEKIAHSLSDIIYQPQYREAATSFQHRYRNFDPKNSVREIAARLAGQLSS